ncbi:MAG: hypothetical protein PHR16_00845 [Methylovulum sp.]|nr:hypothetical protein [Methylovulum sp.]
MENGKVLSGLGTFFLVAIIAGCASAPEQMAAEKKVVNDYPTRDRVEYVLNCVAQHGGLTYITQYACGCKIDKISEKLTFSEYDTAKTFSYLKSTPGENGAVFRDPAQSKSLRSRLKEAEQAAETSCFVK